MGKKFNHYFFEYTISIFDTVLDKPFSLCYNWHNESIILIRIQ